MKTRFCPSPTGHMHIGNVRTALFNALFARAEKGKFLLRIEDTDKLRSLPEFTEMIFEDLHWLDLSWDEGPQKEEGRGPYWQSQRQAIYEKYYAQLEQSQHVYACFCTEEELALARKVQRASGKPPRYPGTCRNLTKEVIEAKLKAGLLATLRFKVPLATSIEFIDMVRGHQRFMSDDIGDFIIRRTDGTSPFIFCNAIDDALMNVTHALRGEDHLTNTPRQIMILQALGLTPPTYAHISLILGTDGTPLSKRNGSRSIKELRELGYLPLAIVNYLARLGHHYKDDSLLSLQQLAEQFETKNLSRAPARFDADQLDRWQKLTVTHSHSENIWKWLPTEIHAVVPPDQQQLFIETVQPNIALPPDGLFWAKIIFNEIHYDDDALQYIKKAGSDFYQMALTSVANDGLDYSALTKTLKEKIAVSGKQLFMPLRAALTGVTHGPELAKLLQLIGLEEVKKRFESALVLTKSN